ncbi:SDR family oxidoreductase [Tropicimonas sp. TH_r6]|uniref:SDR family oxidoreductase n=1 Tax=Tropicimonas sp. TH_r6 TaxID=3082085 RepID=UPI002953E43C|nr:SDR family oxidoreductase [Tropicimonas sp. TH_r6]MDV7142457.1 SDR family oxidoreductase [Tropicimonas sp. TH_r6]
MTKVILVTGTSTGLGIAIAVQAAQAGHIVYATMRNLDRSAALETAAEAAGVALNLMQLDVQDGTSIDKAVARIIREHGRIDTLVNNAGLGFVRNIEQASDAEIARIMDINFMGVVRCTRAVLPHMRAARAGHVVNISSVGGLVGQPFNEIYCGAKFAVEGLTESLASYVTPGFGIDFTTVEPGGIATEFANTVLKEVAETGGMLEDDYLPLLQKYVGGSQSRQDGSDIYQNAEQVADVVLTTIEAETPPLRVRTSVWSEEFTQLKTGLDPDGCKQRDRVVERFLS